MRWIIFDAVGTLIAPAESVAATYHRVAAHHGSRLATEEIRTRFVEAFEASEATSFVDAANPICGRATSEDAEVGRWRWVVRQVLSDVADDSCEAAFQELWRHFAQPRSWRVLPDVEGVLNQLRREGWRLGLASNFDQRLEAIVRGLSELALIERVFVSSQIGWRKPAAEFYRHVMEACGGIPGEICWVGDRADHDLSGPTSAGMRAFLLDETAAPHDPRHLRKIAELPTRL